MKHEHFSRLFGVSIAKAERRRVRFIVNDGGRYVYLTKDTLSYFVKVWKRKPMLDVFGFRGTPLPWNAPLFWICTEELKKLFKIHIGAGECVRFTVRAE